MRDIPESDWKKLRSMKDNALNFSCERILEKIEGVIKERNGKEHEVYLQLWRLLKKEDREIAIMFDDLKRSNSLHKLAAWRRNGIISGDSFAEFSDETQKRVNLFNEY
ncbi:hypothetical protein KAR48_16845 [bacterium]|nr:hypothetical protein [bacterium]